MLPLPWDLLKCSRPSSFLALTVPRMCSISAIREERFEDAADAHGLQVGHDMVFVQWQKDDAGNLVSDIPAGRLEGVPADESTTVTCDEHETCGLFSVDHDQPEMTLIALVGRSGSLELSLVGDSAHLMLGVQVGEKIVVRW